jgi:hypothetical protein
MSIDYASIDIESYVEKAPEAILALLDGPSVDQAVLTLSHNYSIPVSSQSGLSTVIAFTLLGAIEPQNVVQALIDLAGVDEKDANLIAKDLDTSIFQEARKVVLEDQEEVKTLEYDGVRSKEELRKEIMDTTKRESGLNKPQSGPVKKTTIIKPGSRSQLMEQLQVIGSIPDDAEIHARLKLIQDQISSIKKVEDDNTLKSNLALKNFMFGEKGKDAVTPTLKPATYSVAPKEYNVDPYREQPEE